ncbi:MAG: sugar phosphate isomerase/epimerase [Candidatus Firestonebacteria bacterium]
MKIGLFTVLYAEKNFEEMLDFMVANGVEAVELGCGNYPGNAHCKPEELLKNKQKVKNYMRAITERGLVISALSCHGNPVHPIKVIAAKHDKTFRNTVLLAKELGVETVVGFSGLPGGTKGDKTPNWITYGWPNEHSEALKYQWEQVLIPYWKKASKFCKNHKIKIALEMHPNFAVYNPETLLKLRKACGSNIGANFDPSHLYWQGIDPVLAISALKGKIYHFHAKDTRVDKHNTALNGVLDTKSLAAVAERSWLFRTVGYGHDQYEWKSIVSALIANGYNYVMSIEHEDALMTKDEGFKKAVAFLKSCVIKEKMDNLWWA